MNHNTATVDDSQCLLNTRYGVMAAVSDTNFAARSLQQYGEWAEQELDLLSSFIQEGQTIVEFGSDYGAHTLWMARTVGEDGSVHVAEPKRLAFQQLCANIALNGLFNVHADAVWLGRQSGHALLGDLSPECDAPSTERVRTASVDSLDLDALHLLKINRPGTAAALLAGAGETLRRHRPHVYLRLGATGQSVADVSALKSLGYRCWSHLPYLFNPDNFNGTSDNLFPGCVHQNIVAAPIESRVEFDRLREI